MITEKYLIEYLESDIFGYTKVAIDSFKKTKGKIVVDFHYNGNNEVRGVELDTDYFLSYCENMMLDELWMLVIKQQEGILYKSDRYMEIIDYCNQYDIEIPFGVEF